MADGLGREERGNGGFTLAGVGDPERPSQEIQVAPGRVDQRFLFTEFIHQGADAAPAQVGLLLFAVLAVGSGDGVGDIGGFLGFLAEDLDLDEDGVANRVQGHPVLEHAHALLLAELVAVGVFLAPFLLQALLLDHPAQDQFGLDDLEFGLNEIRVIGHGQGAREEAADVRLVALDLDAGGARGKTPAG